MPELETEVLPANVFKLLARQLVWVTSIRRIRL